MLRFFQKVFRKINFVLRIPNDALLKIITLLRWQVLLYLQILKSSKHRSTILVTDKTKSIEQLKIV